MLFCASSPQNPTPQQQEVAGRRRGFCRQAARRTYSFSPASLSCLLVLCRALIHSS